MIDEGYLFSCILNDLWSQPLSITNIIPIKWRLTLLLVEHLIRRQTNGRIITVVVCELNQQVLNPIALEILDTSSQQSSKIWIALSDYLSVCGWKSCTKLQLWSHLLLHTTPKIRSKPKVLVRYNNFWHSMQSHYVLCIQLCQLVHRVLHLHSNEVSSLRQMIYNHPYSVLAKWFPRQS